MDRPASALIHASLSAAVFLSGCLAGQEQGDASDKPQGPLYRCIGEAHYDKGAWESVMKDLKANPPECTDPEAETPVMASLAISPGQETSAGDSVLVHGVVMDSRCDLVTEYRHAVPLPRGTLIPIVMWNGRNAEGAPLPTGEYFVNMELGWQDGRKDTTYQKIGYIQSACPPGAGP